MKMAVKKRCGVLSCRQVLRPDGTCPNPKCVRYVPEEPVEEPEKPQQEASAGE